MKDLIFLILWLDTTIPPDMYQYIITIRELGNKHMEDSKNLDENILMLATSHIQASKGKWGWEFQSPKGQLYL